MLMRLLCLTFLIFIDFGSTEDVILKIRDGQIKGDRRLTFFNKTYFSFQKIPYAAPPVGNLRFKVPEVPNKWDGILDVSSEIDVKCYQSQQHHQKNDSSQSEDCLYINVFTPSPSGNKNLSYPVLFYTHGGSFVHQSSDFHLYGPQFLLDEDIIVVTFNYRLGVFGFLSTGDEIIPGNSALKDQLLALKWVKENIEYFGGDPEKITIVGQSAGAALTSYQLLHTESEGLFRGAILQSASALSPFSMQRYPRVIAFKTAAELNATFNEIDDSKLLLEFLQSVSARDLDEAAGSVHAWASNMLGNISRTYSPVIEVEHDGAFLTKKMYAKLKSGDFVRVPLLSGFNSLEGLGSAARLPKFRKTLRSYDENLDWLVPQDMLIDDIEKRKEMGEKIREIYTKGEPFAEHLVAGVRFIGDNRYTRPVRKFAEMYSKFAPPVYFYHFAYDGFLGNKNIVVKGVTGVAHHEECNYLWHTRKGAFDNGNLDKYPQSDIRTLKRMTRMWANFVKHLNPTPTLDELLQNVTWPTVSSSGKSDDFLHLNINKDLEVKNKLKDKSYSAWRRLYGSLGHDNFDTW